MEGSVARHVIKRTDTQGKTRYENKRKCVVELYEDEIKILKSLIQGEKLDLKNRQDDATKELRPYSQKKVVMALQEMIWGLNELEAISGCGDDKIKNIVELELKAG